MPRYAFQGVETCGILLGGLLPRARGTELAGSGVTLAPSEDPRWARVALLAVRIAGLRTWGLPFPRWTYPETVWMLALPDDGWLAVRAHGPRWVLPGLSLADRYHAEPATIEVAVERLRIDDRWLSSLDAPTPIPAPPLVRRLLTRDRRGRIWEIPWSADAPAESFQSECKVHVDRMSDASFGAPVAWDPTAVAFRDRPHRCAPAVDHRGPP